MGDDDKPCRRWGSATAGGSTRTASALSGLVIAEDLAAALSLRNAYRGIGGRSVFGVVASMPEELHVRGIRDELDRLMYLTLAVAIDYQRDAASLWRHARERFDDPDTRWLFRPRDVSARTTAEVLAALRRGHPQGALRYPTKDAAWWHGNSTTFAREYGGDPRALFERAGWDVGQIRLEVNRRGRFQGLKGAKIFPLWIRVVADILGYRFTGFDSLPIPVDVHIARATFATGVVRGRYKGPLDGRLIAFIRRAWTDVAAAAGEKHMTFDEPLWQLSRLGCTSRHHGGDADCPKRALCPIGDLCPRGTIALTTQAVEIST